ncbi:MAG: FHA domain-containing protein [Tannerella sp.]|jgi:hypothetical protein|nr:FHA domain-containing protein [Tannerella sp.]
MIPVKCPHCHVGLKVDEEKVPQGIDFFKCPKCKCDIPISSLEIKDKHHTDEIRTVVFQPSNNEGGRLTVLLDANTSEQIFPLTEGHFTVGRKATTPTADICIETNDKMMSRSHLLIVVKHDAQGGLIHCLSDNKSKNRTIYNGKYLEDGEEVVLQDNDEIKIGNTVLRFNI